MIKLEKARFDASATGPWEAIASANPRVSARNRWNDGRWIIDGRNPGHALNGITWRPQDEGCQVLQELKLVAASMLLPRGNAKPYLKYSSATPFAIAARYLAEFMQEKSYGSLSELDETAFSSFLEYLKRSASKPSMPSDPDNPDEADADDEKASLAEELQSGNGGSGPEVEVDRPTLSFVLCRIRIWRYIRLAAQDLARAGVRLNPVDPFARESLPKVAARISTESTRALEDLPDPVLLPILTEAYRLIGQPADQVISLQAEYLALGPAASGGDKQKRSARRKLLRQTRLVIKGEKQRWFDLTPERMATPSLAMIQLVQTIRDACLIVLAAGIGWRISEAASVQVEPQDDERLPSCIAIYKSQSGTSDHFFVSGLLSKHREEPTPVDWLIGARLAGTSAEPMTVRAIRVLERLYRPYRTDAFSPSLRNQLIVSWNVADLAFAPEEIRRISVTSIREGMQRFIAERAGLKASLFPLVEADPRLAPYQESGGACVRPHQWRKTFFRLMYRMDESLLPAISRHFKHIDLAMTENHYAPKSAAAIQDRDAAMTEELVDALFARAEGLEPPVAGGGAMLARQRKVLSSIIDGVAPDQAAARLAEFAVGRDLRLWPAEHGACLIALNPDKAACHVRDGRIDWRADRPNLSRRNPALCCSCPNLIVTTKALAFWRRRYRENRKAWLGSGQDPAFQFARDRAAQARTIIEHLGGTPGKTPKRKENL